MTGPLTASQHPISPDSALGVTQPSLFLDWPFPTPIETIPRALPTTWARAQGSWPHGPVGRIWACSCTVRFCALRKALGPIPVDPQMWSSSKRPAHVIRSALQRFKDVGMLRQVRDLYWLQAIPANWDLLTDGHIDGHPVKAKLGQVLALWGPMSKVALTRRAGLRNGILQGELWNWCQRIMANTKLCPTREMAQAAVAAAGLKPALWELVIDTFGPQFCHHLGAAVGGVCRGASDPESGRVPVEDDPVSGLPFTCSEKDHQHRESAISGGQV